MNPLNLIPLPYRIGLEMIILGMLFIGGFLAGQRWEKGDVSEARSRAQICQQSLSQLQEATKEQNAAVEKLKKDSDARAKAAELAMSQASAAAKKYQDEADKIGGLKLPSGADECKEAQQDFDDELRQERMK